MIKNRPVPSAESDRDLTNLNLSTNNLIVEAIAGPDGMELMSYVVARGTTRVFGGSHRKTKDEMTRLPDPGMSVPHFRISNRDQTILLTDCESRNGTMIKGRKITQQTIDDGTIFQAGNTRFQVRWENRPEPPEPKAPPVLVEPTQDQVILPTPDSVLEVGGTSDYHVSAESSIVELPQLPIPKPLEENYDSERPDSSSLESLEPPLPSPPLPNATSKSLGPWTEGDSNVDAVVRLILPTSARWREFTRVLQDLEGNHDGFVVAHFAKLSDHREFTPAGIALFPHLDPGGSVLPVAIDKREWFARFHEEAGERLVGVDGLLAVVCESGAVGIEDSLRDLGVAGIPGFSEPGGFIPWCWPSGLHSLLDSMSDAMIGRWLSGSIQALVFPYRDRILAYTRRDCVEKFIDVGFR